MPEVTAKNARPDVAPMEGIFLIDPIVEYDDRYYFAVHPYGSNERYFVEAPVVEEEGRLYLTLYNEAGAPKWIYVPKYVIKPADTQHVGDFVPWTISGWVPALYVAYRKNWDDSVVEYYFMLLHPEYDKKSEEFHVYLHPGAPDKPPVAVSLKRMAGRPFIIRSNKIETKASKNLSNAGLAMAIPTGFWGFGLLIFALGVLGGGTTTLGTVMTVISIFLVLLGITITLFRASDHASPTVPYIVHDERYVEKYPLTYLERLS